MLEHLIRAFGKEKKEFTLNPESVTVVHSPQDAFTYDIVADWEDSEMDSQQYYTAVDHTFGIPIVFQGSTASISAETPKQVWLRMLSEYPLAIVVNYDYTSDELGKEQ